VAGVAALATAASLLAGCNVSLQSLPKFSGMSGPTYELHATFANVLNLPAEAQVRDGVAQIGQVSAITTHDFEAEVTLRIERRVRLPVGTRAVVQFDDPLGDEYVEMLPPTAGSAAAGYLHDGQTLGPASTGSAPSIADTLAALSTVLNGGGINQLHTIVSELNATFGGNQGHLRDLLSRIEQAFGSLAAHRPDLDAALAALANLARSLNAGTPAIVEGIDALAPAVQVLAGQNTELRRLLTNVNQLATVASDVAAATSQQAINDVHDLLPVVDQLIGVDRRIGPALADIATFEHLTPKIAPGDSLQVSLHATAILSAAAAGEVSAATIQRAASGADGPSSAAVVALLEGALP
jgi:phospholipid/cholesterol/gamma-HCH transport system substrate-binding protein